MKITTFSLILILFASACSRETGSNVTGTPQPEAAAQKSAEQWLALVDAGNYAESWKTAAAYFQTAVSQDQWEHAIVAVRKPLGDLVSRQLKSAQYTRSLPGAPDGEYVVLQFNTSFANKKEAVETITPMLDPDGQWKVSGYYIK
ncbi:MAG TPA: DUF4019 domain-containing protein [Candidatus Limnocylindrales bacterium]|nr:DUF4019 domain-containing protein [Candidatus Limnocylindrales bacterium]